jgi:hypothetical protein
MQMSFDRPLLMPKTEEQSMLAKQRETLIARMNMFIRLRQDLERVGDAFDAQNCSKKEHCI